MDIALQVAEMPVLHVVEAATAVTEDTIATMITEGVHTRPILLQAVVTVRVEAQDLVGRELVHP